MLTCCGVSGASQTWCTLLDAPGVLRIFPAEQQGQLGTFAYASARKQGAQPG